MENKDKKIDKPLTGHQKEDRSSNEKKKKEDKAFPGYPHYPASEDIYNQEEEVDVNPDDLSKTKKQPAKPGKRNDKDFE